MSTDNTPGRSGLISELKELRKMVSSSSERIPGQIQSEMDCTARLLMPGFIVISRALLGHYTNPTIDEIKEALAGNLCHPA
jgi:hypothetical protein